MNGNLLWHKRVILEVNQADLRVQLQIPIVLSLDAQSKLKGDPGYRMPKDIVDHVAFNYSGQLETAITQKMWELQLWAHDACLMNRVIPIVNDDGVIAVVFTFVLNPNHGATLGLLHRWSDAFKEQQAERELLRSP